MPRPKRPRRVLFMPGTNYFRPRGVALADLKEVNLTLDELEAIRLADLDNLEQTQAAKKMKISQSTFQRTIKKAHQKIAQALILGQAIKMKGGEVVMPFGQGRGPGRGLGRGRGGDPSVSSGRGRLGGPFAAGPGGNCVCVNPECKHIAPHVVGQPCYQQKCPKCGSPMVRER